MLTSNSETTTITVRKDSRPSKRNWHKTGDRLCGMDTGSQCCGTSVTPMGMPTSVVMMIPKNSEPLTLRAMSTPLTRMAMMPRIAVGVKVPNDTKVLGLLTMMPAFFSPMNAMNMPMPTEMA